MPLPRFATLDPDRRAAILTAAAEEFARAGLEGASYNQIIARAGASKGAMYYYFDNKEDLFLTVVDDLAARAVAAIGGLAPFTDAAGFWREMLNTNSEYYGGSGEGNGGGLMAQGVPWDGYNQSLEILLPAMSTTVFKWRKEG